jgi:phosphopantetheinyl transferase
MIKLFAASLEALEGRENLLLEQLPTGWADAWTAAHPTMHRADSRVASLAGIWLATQAGTKGSLRYDGNEKPHVDGVEISISHTARYALCAISDGEAPIGLDAEDMVGRLNKDRRLAMAERWFSADERAEAVKSEEAFYRIWTRKEAYVKRLGTGLRDLSALDTVSVRDCRFTEYRLGETCITLACAPDECPPEEICMVE